MIKFLKLMVDQGVEKYIREDWVKGIELHQSINKEDKWFRVTLCHEDNRLNEEYATKPNTPISLVSATKMWKRVNDFME